MDIIFHKNYQDLLSFLPFIKDNLKEWQFIDIKLSDDSKDFSAEAAASLVQGLFKENEGMLYLCSAREILMFIRWGVGTDSLIIPKRIADTLPLGSCKVRLQEPTPEGLNKLEILIRHTPAATPTFADDRRARRENVVLVADDDMYMRTLVKKGTGTTAGVYEVGDGKEVVAAYKTYLPDILFLDIHLPGRGGMEVLSDIKAIDPDAYIIMLSSDSSQENVIQAVKHGAKGFMAKPFTKEKLLEHFKKCPTFY